MVATIVAAALVLAAVGCGTRQSRSAVEAAAGGSPARAVSAGNASGPSKGGSEATGGEDTATSAVAPGEPATGDHDVATGPTAAGDAPGAQDAAAGGAAGAPIVIGNVSTTSGLAGVAQAPGVRGLQAWVAMINAAGGINGHPIRLVLADDAGDPARHAAAVKDLVENKGVIAFVSNWASQTIQASRAYLEQKRIPAIGGDSSTSFWFASPMLFAQGPTPENFIRARLKSLAAATDKRTIATVVCREAAVCAEQAASVKRHAPEFGLRVVYEGQASLAQPDFTAECLSAENAGAEIILPVFDAPTMRRIAQSCDRQGFRPTYDLASAYEADFADIPAFEGAVMSHFTFQPHADAPAAKAFRDALARYAPNQPPVPIAGSGWSAGVLFGKVASVAFPAGATPATAPLLDALWNVQNDTVDGTTGPLTFRRDQPSGPTAPRCMFTERILGGKIVAPNGMEPTCV